MDEEDDAFCLVVKLMPRAVHRGVSGVVVRVELTCDELDFAWDEIATFSAVHDVRQWSSCRWDLSEQLDHEQFGRGVARLSLVVTLTVMKLFGRNDEAIADKERYRYLRTVEAPRECKDAEEVDKATMMGMLRNLQRELESTRKELAELKGASEAKEADLVRDDDGQEEAEEAQRVGDVVDDDERKLACDGDGQQQSSQDITSQFEQAET